MDDPMDEFGNLAWRELEARRAARRQIFWLHFFVWALTGVLLAVIWVLATRHSMPWFVIPICAWGIFLGAHAAYAFIVRTPQEIIMERERRAKEGAQ
jgi:2TM domain